MKADLKQQAAVKRQIVSTLAGLLQTCPLFSLLAFELQPSFFSIVQMLSATKYNFFVKLECKFDRRLTDYGSKFTDNCCLKLSKIYIWTEILIILSCQFMSFILLSYLSI